MLENRWVRFLLLVLLCLLLGLIDAVRSYTSAYQNGVFLLDWGTAVQWDLVAWLAWIPLIPLILYLARRFPITPKNWSLRTPLFLVLGSAVAAAKTVFPIILFLTFNFSESLDLTWLSERPWLLNDFLTAYVFYCFVVAFAQALSFYRQYREEELRASKLESQFASAELRALKMQLHPHFLFNTLHSISALQFEDPDAAQTMAARLGDFLRLTLDDAGAQIVSLRREIDFLECYLDIERVRFGERLTTEVEIPPETLDAQVPNLILQPLVENAIKHGVAKQAGAGLIRIASKVVDGRLLLEVADNGPGLPQNGDGMSGLDNRGVGLANVRERLKQLYGENHSLELKNSPRDGLVVTIALPLSLADRVARVGEQ